MLGGILQRVFGVLAHFIDVVLTALLAIHTLIFSADFDDVFTR
jgi:hypothetical protein